jgi:hypothetical protein
VEDLSDKSIQDLKGAAARAIEGLPARFEVMQKLLEQGKADQAVCQAGEMIISQGEIIRILGTIIRRGSA